MWSAVLSLAIMKFKWIIACIVAAKRVLLQRTMADPDFELLRGRGRGGGEG